MTTSEFKKIARLLKDAYLELETQAIKNRVSLFSKEYQDQIDVKRQEILKRTGFTLDEYIIAKSKYLALSPENRKAASASDLQSFKKVEIPTTADIEKIATGIAEKVVKPAQLTKEVIKQVTIEKPTIVKETKIEHITSHVKYDERPLQERISSLSKKVDEFKPIPPPDLEAVKAELRSEFSQWLEYNINMLGMPNFRKLAMGLQGQIDALRTSGAGLTKLTTSQVPKMDGSVIVFTFTTAPAILFLDGVAVQKVSSDGTINWTGTTTVTINTASIPAPTFDIFGL